MHELKIRKEIEAKRLLGISAEELSRTYSIPRGTVYYWTKDIILDGQARAKLKKKSADGRKKGSETIKENRKKENDLIESSAIRNLETIKVNVEISKIFCSLLFWAEGAKKSTSMRFINSDPVMIKTFLKLLRSGFEIDETKFRAIVHIHQYHDDLKIREYWSKVTSIPLSQFNKSYRKMNTGLTKKEGYLGCITIYYFDAKIAKELTSLYGGLYSILSGKLA